MLGRLVRGHVVRDREQDFPRVVAQGRSIQHASRGQRPGELVPALQQLLDVLSKEGGERVLGG